MGLTESDTRAKLIDPAIHARGWNEEHIRREETAGAVEIIDGRPRKKARGRVDYVLRLEASPDRQPIAIAIIEAKAENLAPNHGLEQAKSYTACKRMNVQFVFSSNGHQFVEFDRFTGKTTQPQPTAHFPTPNDLQTRYEQGMGFDLNDPLAKPLSTKYVGGEATRRYYQDAAIRSVFEKIAQCQKRGTEKRALLSLATGAGKTFIAVHLLKRIADSGQLKRALFVCDRDELRTQGLAAFQNLFGNDAAAVSTNNPQKNARILVATYQTLGIEGEDGDASFLIKNYPKNYFSHIVIDECHRSAWGKWSVVLTRNPEAVQIELTATPRKIETTETPEARNDQQITSDNLDYFGDPVYEYDISQGIEDGYLAACEIHKGRVNLDQTGLTIDQVMARNPRHAITGALITREEVKETYEKNAFENGILLPDRVAAMCQDLFQYFIDNGTPEQKTIIFCARDRHADDVAATMNNLYVDWCKKQDKQPVGTFAFKCTAAGGKDCLAELRGASRSHFIATTVDLLTTGVDVPCLQNIVFFKYVRSPISFYQMIGRGTRLDPPTGKLMFRIYDYTNATALFGRTFITKKQREGTGGGTEPPETPQIIVEGFDVRVSPAGRFILTNVDGRAVPVTIEEYKERLAERLVEEIKTINEFRECWISPKWRREILGRLPDAGRSPILIQRLEEMNDFDLFDVLGELGYGLLPKTRIQRTEAFYYKHQPWLSNFPLQTCNTLTALVNVFSNSGTDGLESPAIFHTPEIAKAGGLKALRIIGKPSEILNETKLRIFAA